MQGSNPAHNDVPLTVPTFLILQALKIFQPGKVSMALSVDQADSVDQALVILGKLLRPGYACPYATTQRLDCGGAVAFYNMEREGKEPGTPGSPHSMHHAASCLSVGTAASMIDIEGSNSDPEHDHLVSA